MNYIEELYYGNIEPQELTTEFTPKLKKKLRELVSMEEELSAELSDKEKKMLSEFINAYNEFSSISNSDSFISGFRLGARLTYDTFVL